ncbi:hypothetical protein [Cupriavidus basilensis]|uniref:hypothetical protein n=1 Tax=Cupriavidus basilensis TaxID=68895 RepID=UPI0009E3449D|nr:hypothetical protein [Cupriavidus basilensis]
MEELSKAERDALHLVSVGAIQIRLLARSLPDSAEKQKILALAEGMHNIPMIVAGTAEERQAHSEVVAGGVAQLNAALGRNKHPDGILH